LLNIDTGFRKFGWISWISTFSRTPFHAQFHHLPIQYFFQPSRILTPRILPPPATRSAIILIAIYSESPCSSGTLTPVSRCRLFSSLLFTGHACYALIIKLLKSQVKRIFQPRPHKHSQLPVTVLPVLLKAIYSYGHDLHDDMWR